MLQKTTTPTPAAPAAAAPSPAAVRTPAATSGRGRTATSGRGRYEKRIPSLAGPSTSWVNEEENSMDAFEAVPETPLGVMKGKGRGRKPISFRDEPEASQDTPDSEVDFQPEDEDSTDRLLLEWRREAERRARILSQREAALREEVHEIDERLAGLAELKALRKRKLRELDVVFKNSIKARKLVNKLD